MNPGRGWNPDLEESYLPEYREYEAETFTKFKTQIFIRLVKILESDLSPISLYRESSRITKFSPLGFSGMNS